MSRRLKQGQRDYIIYDGRACRSNNSPADTDDCTVLCYAYSLEEARDAAKNFGFQCAIYSYAVNPKKGCDGELTDERWEEDYNP